MLDYTHFSYCIITGNRRKHFGFQSYTMTERMCEGRAEGLFKTVSRRLGESYTRTMKCWMKNKFKILGIFRIFLLSPAFLAYSFITGRHCRDELSLTA